MTNYEIEALKEKAMAKGITLTKIEVVSYELSDFLKSYGFDGKYYILNECYRGQSQEYGSNFRLKKITKKEYKHLINDFKLEERIEVK